MPVGLYLAIANTQSNRIYRGTSKGYLSRGFGSSSPTCPARQSVSDALIASVPSLQHNQNPVCASEPKPEGLAVPGMPVGSPGMEEGSAEPYEVVMFGLAGRRTYMRFVGDRAL
jgi:hypothetical protein